MSHATAYSCTAQVYTSFRPPFVSGWDTRQHWGETWRTKDDKAVSFEMFTSQARIDRKTGPDNLGRFEYLQALVTEFQDTDRQGNVFKNSIHCSEPE